jgi:Concanavalin A-like lectin/glucanases superfamily
MTSRRFPLGSHRTFAVAAVGLLAASAAHANSLRFFGNGVDDIDRVKIRIDDPANNNPGPPADVGSTDFTIEFWLRSDPTANAAPAIACGANINWIYGNIVFDRDRYNQNRGFGISLGAGRVAFGTYTSAQRTICGTTDLRDGAWHHVAVQRRFADGQLTLYVDGQLEQSGDTPNNEDISYPDNGVPGSFCGGPCTNSDPFIVLGAEKHDAGSQYPSFNGWLDELRISTVLRYSVAFTPPRTAFITDAGTAALYHFDEPNGTDVLDSASGGASPGVLRVGGNPSGPLRSAETPFNATSPVRGYLPIYLLLLE